MSTDVAALPAATPAMPVPATLTTRASLNAVQSLLDYAARLGVGLVITPLLVSRFGRELFGVWEMLNRLIGYMSAADGRPTEALRLVIATKQAAANVIGGGLTAGAVYAGLGLVGVAGAQVALMAITGVCFWILVKRYVASFGVARPSAPEVRSLLGMSVWIAIGEVVAKLATASDVIILGMVASPALVTTYVLTGYAGRIALGLHVFTTGAAMPGLGGVIGRGEYEWAARLRREIMNLTWLFVTAVGATILLWNRSFLALWVGPVNYAGFWTNLLIVIVTVQTALVRSDAYVLDATLQPRLRVRVAAVAAVVIIGASLALTPALGMVGVCLGVLAGRLVQSIAYPLLVDRSLHRPPRLAVRPIIRPLLVMLLLFGVTAVLGARVLA